MYARLAYAYGPTMYLDGSWDNLVNDLFIYE